MDILRVIFMLSTVVHMTDCCSSRILLLKEQSLIVLRKPFAIENDHHCQDHINSKCRDQQQQHIHNKSSSDEMHFTTVDGESFGERRTNHQNTKNNNSTATPPSAVTPSLSHSVRQNTNVTVEQGQKSNNISSSRMGSSEREEYAAASDSIDHPIDLYYAIMRDVLSFECVGVFLTEFCLHGGRCFRYPIANQSFFSCECAEGYVGERCEAKNNNMSNGSEETEKPQKRQQRQAKIFLAEIGFSMPMLITMGIMYLIFFGAFVILKCPTTLLRREVSSTPAVFRRQITE